MTAAQAPWAAARLDDVETALAGFVAGLDPAGLDPALLHEARTCLVDGIGAAMDAQRAPEARQALAAVDEPGTFGEGGATVLRGLDSLDGPRTGRRLRAADAAFVNAVAAAATIRTDTHAQSASHPGMVVLPVVLALAQVHGATAADLLGAIVAGYEVSIRLGLALVTPELSRRFRPTGLTGAVGAAAAAARLRRLNVAQTRTALALAANTASGLNEWARAGTSEHVFHAGTAARNAIAAVRLASAGAVAAPRSLSGPSGLLAAYGAADRVDRLVDGLGERFHLRDVVHKRVPACVFAQAPCQAALALVDDERFARERIASVRIGVAAAAAAFPGCDFAGPFETPSAAQQSIQFGVASVLHAGGVDESLWAAPRSANLDALAARCRVVVDAAVDARHPARLGAAVTVLTTDGERLDAAVAEAAPMDDRAIDARFLADAAARLAPGAAARLLGALRALGPKDSEQPVLELLRDC